MKDWSHAVWKLWFFFFFWPFIFHAKCSLTQSLLLSLGLTERLVKTSRNERVTLNLTTSWEQTASLLGVELRYHTEDVAERWENLFTFEGKESVPRACSLSLLTRAPQRVCLCSGEKRTSETILSAVISPGCWHDLLISNNSWAPREQWLHT